MSNTPKPIEDPATRFVWWPLGAAALLLGGFHLWANLGFPLGTQTLNSLHFGLMGGFAGLWIWNQQPGPTRWWWLAVGAACLISGCYFPLAEEALRERGERLSATDTTMGITALVALLLLCRKLHGWIMPVLALLVITYILFWGQWIGGVFHFRGLGLERILYRFSFTDEGLFGFVTTISATYIVLFITFSAFLLRSGAADFILRLARAATRNQPGGAGYVAVFSSALTGMVNGSSIANTVATGSVTIPLMIRHGFSPRFAAALEASASTGGQLLPPVMGAGAFILAQNTGLSYLTIIGAALLPALLFFSSLLVSVWVETRRTHMTIAPTSSPDTHHSDNVPLWREGLPFLLPLTTLVTLLYLGFMPVFAAGWAIIAVIAASWLTPSHRMGPRAIAEALLIGMRFTAPTALLLIAAGIIIGGLNLTGAGVAFSQMLVTWSAGSLPLALLLVAIASLILGMGLPVTASYVVVAVVAAPALGDLGVPLLAAHLYIFWLSQDSNVTPPICLNAYAAAGIAGSPPVATGLTAWKLSKGLYFIPLAFVYQPALLSAPWGTRLLTALPIATALIALTLALSLPNPQRTTSWIARILLFASGALLLFPLPWPLLLLTLTTTIASASYLIKETKAPQRPGLQNPHNP